ncbi:MAG TPA: hypothetical protein VHL58_09900 [Thermoanaerobaculia bacterium]|nr:hypothetical protein [Thermoanaerobaculia bacterium]
MKTLKKTPKKTATKSPKTPKKTATKTAKKTAKRTAAKNPYIRRIDSDAHHVHGWQVQIKRQGVALYKMFSDRPNGGKGAALKAAVKYRDLVLPR